MIKKLEMKAKKNTSMFDHIQHCFFNEEKNILVLQ